MRFVFIRAHARIHHVTTMCRVLEVSRARYYAWCARPLYDRAKDDMVLRERIRHIHEQVKGRYGSPRVRMELRALGIRCGEHRVPRLMRGAGLRRYRVTTQSAHAQPVARNVLDRQFSLTSHPKPDRVWAADLTNIPTREGWL